MSDKVYLIGEQNFNCDRREYVALGTKEGRHIAVALTASGVPFGGKVSDERITFAYDADYKEEVDEIIKKATSEEYADFRRELNENYQGEKCMHSLPDAEVVRKIFKLCIDGYGPVQIARILTEQNIPTPTAYALSQGRDNGQHNAKLHRWGANTITHILERLEYCGHTVNFKTHMKSYKVHKIVYNPQEEWQIFENTHEPIISQQIFDLVQELRKNKRRPQRSEKVNPFAGMVYCADCGEKMYLSRRKNERPEQEHMRCSTYAKEQDKCTVHYIRTCVLNEIVLGELNKLLTMVRGNEDEFIKRVMSSSVQRKSSELAKAKKTLKQAEKRIAELDKLFTRLYEDNVLGRLSDERFEMMLAGYEDEQAKLKATSAELTAFVEF